MPGPNSSKAVTAGAANGLRDSEHAGKQLDPKLTTTTPSVSSASRRLVSGRYSDAAPQTAIAFALLEALRRRAAAT